MPTAQPNEPYRSALATFLASKDADISAANWQSLKLTQHLTGAIALSPTMINPNPGQSPSYQWDVTLKLFIKQSTRESFLTLADRWGWFIQGKSVMQNLSVDGVSVSDSHGDRTIFKGVFPLQPYTIEATENQDAGAEGFVTWRYRWIDRGVTEQVWTF